MDYEKAYKEALNWMRGIYPTLAGSDKEDAEHYFPELRESEDERIRKWIYTCIEALGYPADEDAEKELEEMQPLALAWLEKQKEQKPAEKQDYSGLNDFERAIHRGFLCAGVVNVPVNIIKEAAQDCLAHLPAEWRDRLKDEIKHLKIDVYDQSHQFDLGARSSLTFLESFIDSLTQEQPENDSIRIQKER